jgi:hypothetical protein
MNTTDVDAEKYIKIFTFLDKKQSKVWLKIINSSSYEGFTKKDWLRNWLFSFIQEDLEKKRSSICYLEMQLPMI